MSSQPSPTQEKPSHRTLASCFRPRIFCKENCPVLWGIRASPFSTHQRPTASHNRGMQDVTRHCQQSPRRTSLTLLRPSVLKATSLRWIALGRGDSKGDLSRTFLCYARVSFASLLVPTSAQPFPGHGRIKTVLQSMMYPAKS